MPYRNVLAIINPRAGRKNSEKDVPRLLEERCRNIKARLTVRMVTGALDTRVWSEAAAKEGFDVLVIAGGDGTLNEAIAGLRTGGMLPLVLLPTGSTNLVAQELKIPKAVSQAVPLLSDGVETSVDLAYLPSHDRVMVTSVVVGYGSRIVEDAKQELKSLFGYPAYLLSALKNIIRVPTATFLCVVDGVEKKLTGQMAMVSNMNYSSLKLVNLGPTVRHDDGKLNLVIFNHASILQIVELVANMALYPNKPKAQMTMFEGKGIELTSTPTLPITIDGEIVQGDRVAIECVPKGMTVLAPSITKKTR